MSGVSECLIPLGDRACKYFYIRSLLKYTVMASKGLKISVNKCLHFISIVIILCYGVPTIWSLLMKSGIFSSSCDETQSDNMSYMEMWRDMKNISNNLSSNLNMFKMRLEEEELNLMLEMLEAFSKTMDKYNLTYFMDAGTLLGSYRHHGMIPWDDDIDLIADIRQQRQIVSALKSMSHKYEVSIHSKALLKLHSKEESKTISKPRGKTNYAWKWPFLDIFWYRIVKKGVIHKAFDHREHNISDIFPLRKRPFGTVMLNSPCNSDLFLKIKFKEWNTCVTPGWNHVTERRTGLKKVRAHCGAIYPEVQRKKLENGTTYEYLFYKDKLISSFIEHPKC